MPVRHSLYREAGVVAVTDKCTNCGVCARACPTGVLGFDNQQLQVHPESTFGCIACGHCMMVCPTASIHVTGRDISSADLLPLAAPEERASWQSLTALMHARRSIRTFKEEEPTLAVLEQVVAIAASAPVGVPPWDVGCVIIHGRSQVRTLAQEIIVGYAKFLNIFKPWLIVALRWFIARPTYEKISEFVLPLAKACVAGRAAGKDYIFYDAPAVLVFHHSAYADAADAMIACTYAMLAAESLGLGTTMIGSAAPIIMRNRKLCQRLGIPPGNTPAIALILGYPLVHFKRSIARRFTTVSRITNASNL